MKPVLLCTLIAGVALFASGCASPNVNPSKPRAGKGYVDFYADVDGGVAWDIQTFDDGKFKTAFSDVEVPEGGILRLAFPPGVHRFRVSVLDNVVQAVPDISVTVVEGKIVPVEVSLVPVGSAQVKSETKQVGKTYLGSAHRYTGYDYTKTQICDVIAEAQDPQAYAQKEKMPYFEKPSK